MRCRAFPPGEKVSAECSRYSGFMARRARDSVAPLRLGRFSAEVRHMHPATVREASLVTGSMRRVSTTTPGVSTTTRGCVD